MDNTYSPNSKVCATCNFWMGQRNLNSPRTLVKCIPGTDGDCLEGGMKRTHKMNNASCSKWQRWSVIRYNDNNEKRHKNIDNKGKKSYPFWFLALILLAGIIKFVLEYRVYFISIGIIVIFCFVVCLIIYKKAKRPKKKIIFTILIGIFFSIGAFSIIKLQNKS